MKNLILLLIFLPILSLAQVHKTEVLFNHKEFKVLYNASDSSYIIEGDTVKAMKCIFAKLVQLDNINEDTFNMILDMMKCPSIPDYLNKNDKLRKEFISYMNFNGIK